MSRCSTMPSREVSTRRRNFSSEVRQFPGQLLPLGHVQDGLHRPPDAALLVVNRRGRVVQVALPAPEVRQILVRLIGPRQVGRRLQVLVAEKLLQRLDVLLHHQRRHAGPLVRVKRQPVAVGAHHLVARKPGQLLAGLVPIDDPVVPVDDEGGHRHALQDAFGGLLLPQQLPFRPLALGDVLKNPLVAGDAPVLVPPHDAGEQRCAPAPAPGWPGSVPCPG